MIIIIILGQLTREQIVLENQSLLASHFLIRINRSISEIIGFFFLVFEAGNALEVNFPSKLCNMQCDFQMKIS